MIGFRAAAAFGICAGCHSAMAAEQSPPAAGWTVTARGNGYLSPAYEGSSSLAPLATPSLSVRRAGTSAPFFAPDDSIGLALFDASWLKAGVAGKFKAARAVAGHPELKGLQSVDWTLEGGVFAELWPMEKLRTRIEVRRGFHGHEGVVGNVAADWVERIGPWTLSGGPRLAFANDRFMSTYYSVTPLQSQLSGVLPPYRAKAGLKSAGVAAAARYQWDRHWETMLYAQYDRLAANAARSPIVARVGSRDQYTAGLAVSYAFDIAPLGFGGM